MTLYKRTLLVISLTLVAAVIVLYVSSQVILLKGYEQLEVQDTTRHVQHIVNTLNADIEALKTIALNWSRWDDVRDFIQVPRSAFARDFGNEYVNSTFVSTDLDVAIFLNARGQITYQKAVDATTRKEVPVPTALLESLKPGSPLLNHSDIKSDISGILRLPNGHLELVSLPVSNSMVDGPINGYLIWGRYLNEEVIKRISDIVGTPITLANYNSSEFSTLKKSALASGAFFVNNVTEAESVGYGLINDVYGNPSLVASVDMPRLIYTQGKSGLSYFIVSFIVVALLFAGVSIWMLNRSVLARLTTLSASVSHIRRSNDLTTPITVTGDDELGNLATGLKDMLVSLGQSRLKLEDANRELEQRVSERTADLSQANARLQQEILERQKAQIELAKTRDQALEALNLKTQILASISHDSRVPLSTIQLTTEMLQRKHYGDINERQHSVLESILTSAQQLLSFINQLLDDAQIGSGRMRLAHIPLEPERLLEDVTKIIAPLAERKGVILKTEVAPDVPARLLGDPARLKQIVTNLADNALKFTDEGLIEIRFARKDADNWCLQVRDSGPGIPEDLQPRIFEAFWQINSTATKDTNRGVGLGLSIVRQLVTLMKGEITVDSKPACGSTFTVTLPIEEDVVTGSIPELVGQAV